MNTDKVSIIIPARNEPYLQKTIDEFLTKARDDIEVIVILDGYWPDPPLKDDKRLIILHRSEPRGMTNGINSAVAIAKGKYILKNDAHCMWAEGFDVALKNDCEENWLSVPPRFSLNVEKWELNNKPAVCYNVLTFPYTHDEQFGTGFHGKKMTDGNMGVKSYYGPEERLKDKLIDDIITVQGSAMFMHRSHFLNIDGQDEVHCRFFQEPQEMTFKTWLIGGRCIVNKKTWYAHWHKNEGSGYGWSKGQKSETERFSTWVWMNNKWPKQVRPFKWLIEKFMPMPGWPADWESYIKDEKDFRIFDPEGNDGYKLKDGNG